jgi:ABC-type polysaccharide/polyol phosphate transport system ATPase subunit
MPVSAILVESLSKRYLVGHRFADGQHVTFRDVIARGAKNVIRKTVDVIKGRQIVQGDEVEEFWALRDVSFEIMPGEIVGVVGRNGAGKSTLLKILSGITEPTEGRVTLAGRVASLLEVGTGFHPELSGRENIFLNGAILGMTRREISKKFDEIVAFAEVERFLDTPVKHYSSGMYVRLAFAIAAHLEPEVLIIDEVLAVGDAEFQKKCLGKVREVSSGEGRTVLFVSHNMSAVSALCGRALFLERGRLLLSGPTDEVLSEYRRRYQHGDNEEVRVVTPALRWRGLLNRDDLDGLRSDQDIILDLGFETGLEPVSNLQVDCELTDEGDRKTVHCRSKFIRPPISIPSNTRFVVRYAIRSPRLAPGRYHLIVYAASGTKELCWIEHIDACTISAASPFSQNAVLDTIRGTTVPDFAIELLVSSPAADHEIVNTRMTSNVEFASRGDASK